MSVLAARGLVHAQGGRDVLHGIDLAFESGEVAAIVGPNGAGKTTLLRHLAGLDPPTGGEVELAGKPIGAWSDAERARKIAYLPQSAAIYWPLMGRDLVALGRLPHGVDLQRPLAVADAAAVQSALKRVGAQAFVERPIDQLSQGERARLMLARALATEASVLLADEPAASLDPGYGLDAMAVLRVEAARGAAIVVTLHDLGLAARFADRVIVLAAGRVAADGLPRTALAPEIIGPAYGVGFRTVTVDGVDQPVAWTRDRSAPLDGP